MEDADVNFFGKFTATQRVYKESQAVKGIRNDNSILTVSSGCCQQFVDDLWTQRCVQYTTMHVTIIWRVVSLWTNVS